MLCSDENSMTQCRYYGYLPNLLAPGFSFTLPVVPNSKANAKAQLSLMNLFEAEGPVLCAMTDLPNRSNSVRLVILSDTHELHRKAEVPMGDILIHCGDILNGTALFHRPYEKLLDFFKWFNSHPHPVKLFIAGNHDKLLAKMTDKEVQCLAAPAIYLNNSSVIVEPINLHFYGSPRSTPNSRLSIKKAFQSKRHWASFREMHWTFDQGLEVLSMESRLSRRSQANGGNPFTTRVEKDPSGPIDVLITHQSADDSQPSFMQPVLAYIEEVAPRRLHCCGHLHRSNGLHRLDVPETNRESELMFQVVDGVRRKVPPPFLPSINAAMLVTKGCSSSMGPCSVVDLDF